MAAAAYRTQVFNPEDMPNVVKIQPAKRYSRSRPL